MARTIMIDGDEQVACPKCSHRFALSEGISRQAIERHAGELERSLAEHKKKLEAQLAAEAKAQFDTQVKALNEALGAKEGSLAKFRADELALRKQLREAEDALHDLAGADDIRKAALAGDLPIEDDDFVAPPGL